MTEIEWLKQESGMTDEELKAIETVAGAGKFKAFLVKAVASNAQAAADKQTAEQARVDLENRYNNEFVPEMRKVTQDALQAQGEAARMKAQLDKAREYGIVPEPDRPAVDPNAPAPRAPGSPDPNAVSRDDLGRFGQGFTNDVITLNDLNAEHFKLFGAPLGDTQALVDERARQRTLGNKGFSLKQAWESKYDVPKKRDELKAIEQTKHDDGVRAEERKKIAESGGSHPGLRSGQPSRFSTYKPSDTGAEPWKAPHSKVQANKGWRENALSKVREAVAA